MDDVTVFSFHKFQCCFPLNYCIKVKAWKKWARFKKRKDKISSFIYYVWPGSLPFFFFFFFFNLDFFFSFIKMQCPLVDDSIWASFPSLPDNINGELLSCSDPVSKLSSAILVAPTITQAVGAKQIQHLDLSYLFCKAPQHAWCTDVLHKKSTVPCDYTAGHEHWQQSWELNSGVYGADKCRDILILGSLSYQQSSNGLHINTIAL